MSTQRRRQNVTPHVTLWDDVSSERTGILVKTLMSIDFMVRGDFELIP